MKKIRIKQVNTSIRWEKVEAMSYFKFPWRSEKPPVTEFRAYYDQDNLNFQFKAYGPSPLIYYKDNNKLDVRFSERVEIFFRTDEKMDPYYVLEIDPTGRILDYKAKHYRSFDREWQWPDDLKLETTINDDHYLVSGNFRLNTLRSLNLLQDQTIELGLYRGHCTEITNDKATIKWISWIDPMTATPDFHVPSSFGLLELS